MDDFKNTFTYNVHTLKEKAGKYAIYGALIGVASIIIATLLAAFVTYDAVTLEAIVNTQKTNVAIWFLDATPFLFALWGQSASTAMAYEAGAMVFEQTSELRMHASALESQVMRDQTHDPLTGLPNRALFIDRLNQALKNARQNTTQLAILYLEINQLSEINNSFGRFNGDRFLHQFSVRVKSVIQEPCTFARFNESEFGIILPKINSSKDAIILCDKIHQSLETPFVLEDLSVSLQVDIGMALMPDHGSDSETLAQRAEVAMYAAKQGHEKYVIYSTDLDKHSQRRLLLMAELRQAIETDALVLYYQPKVNFQTGEISAEALVRWNHPTQGLIFPDEFIPAAERTGLIKAISVWVLNNALKQCTEWNNQGFNIGISINLSTIDLMDVELPDKIAGQLAGHALSPEKLMVEVTESAIMRDQERALQILERINSLGVKISIDDYGTGYSSLAYLSKLPATELKIDKSFVMTMQKNESNAMIVRATIDLAHNLSLKVVAEGVEDQGAYDQLKALDCDIAQGYFISKPIPAESFENWLKTSSWAKVA